METREKMDNKESLKDKTLKDMIWSFMDTMGSRLIQLGIQVFLARLLLPNDYGIVGMVTIFIILAEVIIDSGFSTALVREKDANQEDFSTVFFYYLFVSSMLYLILYFSAGYISTFFDETRLVSVVRVYGLVLIIEAIGSVQKIILRINLAFSIQMKINIFSSVFSGGIAIVMAMNGYGLWSLVAKMLILYSTQTILYCLTNKWRPSFVFSVTSFKKLFDFGWKIFASKFVTVFYENLYTIIIGRGFSTAILGYYTNAKSISDTASVNMAMSVEKVSFPVLSKFQDDDIRLKAGFKRLFKTSVFITFPVMLGLVVIAPSLFRIFLGDNWVPAIPYFQLLCISGLFVSLHMINLNILQVKGRSELLLKVNIIEKTIGFITVVTVFLLGLGIHGLLIGLIFDNFVTYFINASYSKELIAYSIKEQLRDMFKVSFITFVMTGAAYSLNFIIIENDMVLIISQIFLSIMVYFLLSFLLRVKELNTIYQVLQPIQRKSVVKREL